MIKIVSEFMPPLLFPRGVTKQRDKYWRGCVVVIKILVPTLYYLVGGPKSSLEATCTNSYDPLFSSTKRGLIIIP